jgi:hypothetical protein
MLVAFGILRLTTTGLHILSGSRMKQPLPWHNIIIVIGYCYLLKLLVVQRSGRTTFVKAQNSVNCAVHQGEDSSTPSTKTNIDQLQIDSTMEETMSTTTHVMVLAHGIMGNHKELAYVKQALEREFVAATTAEENFLVYSASSNDHNTLDGIEAGGRRLAEEINDLLKSLSQKTTPRASASTISLSILGNSLGGLYARYALAHIDWKPPPEPQSSNGECEDSYVPVIPRVFVSIAAPHLGVRDMTYWKVPRSFQPAGAWYMKQSGSDLFRYTDIICRMCQEDEFLLPLSNFTSRIAYANAFSTDAAVPTSTAAFLSDSSSTVHQLVQESSSSPEQDKETDQSAPCLHVNSTYPTIRFQTQASFGNSRQEDTDIQRKSEEDNVESYSRALDSLGWTKVFLDLRSHIPALWRRGSRRDDLHSLVNEQRQDFTSAELIKRLSTFDYNTLPFGHSFLVASAKNPLYSWFYSGGRPLVDRIAKELVQAMKTG